ncbi:zinc finger BED domain-containing 4-like [Brachionus plicatilis]|uniref:Zinc finger BED domain-containing 4-like n=1 Tax=Brachionus plicatilis TaxID=10195 RepID=A0A3M7SD66_BRAPC|nr:zinc finger BED domain-containing 4-like [Brachionus plicatilis]
MLQFIKWFVVSNSSFNNLKIPYLRNILDKTLNIPSYYIFRSKLLPGVLDKLYFAIENKLKEAVSVSLVLDLWTNNFNIDFIAFAAMLSFKTMEKESLVIAMTPMPGRHTSANINKAFLKLLQRYNFNRKKIHGIVCDEGSSLVKHFSQIDFSIEEYDIEKNTDEKNFDEPAFVDENIYQENEEAQMTENYSDDDSTAEFDKVYNIPKMSSTDEDIIEIFQEFQELNYKYEISSNGKEVELGVNKVPRFSCACHKANLAVRHAISLHKIGDDLKKLNLVNSQIRKSIQLNKTFNKSQATNATRWSSAFLMLELVKRAYDKELFNEENEDLTCPLSLKEVETYLQILRPAYRFSLTFQNSFSSISHLIPSLKRIFFSWENMDLEPEFERLAILLVVCFKEKFKYELESEIYQAATVLNLAIDTIALESPQPTIQQTDNEAMFFVELMRDVAMKKQNIEPEIYKIEVELDRKFLNCQTF